jgi:hypothetical protein
MAHLRSKGSLQAVDWISRAVLAPLLRNHGAGKQLPRQKLSLLGDLRFCRPHGAARPIEAMPDTIVRLRSSGRSDYGRHAEPEYTMSETHRLGKARTIVAAPLLCENVSIGTINLAHR